VKEYLDHILFMPKIFLGNLLSPIFLSKSNSKSLPSFQIQHHKMLCVKPKSYLKHWGWLLLTFWLNG